MTLQLARDLGVPEVEVVRAFPTDRVMELDIARWEELLRSLEALGSLRVLVSNGAATIEVDGQFGGFSRAGEFFNVQTESLDLHIRWKCLLGNPFAHPTVMLRLDLLDRHSLRYDEAFRTAQDYELWTRLLTVTRGANLAERLLKYRLRHGVSRVQRSDQLSNHDRIAHAAIQRLVPGFAMGEQEVTELRGRFGGHSVREPGMDPKDRRWQQKYQALRFAFAAQYGSDPAARVDPCNRRHKLQGWTSRI